MEAPIIAAVKDDAFGVRCSCSKSGAGGMASPREELVLIRGYSTVDPADEPELIPTATWAVLLMSPWFPEATGSNHRYSFSTCSYSLVYGSRELETSGWADH